MASPRQHLLQTAAENMEEIGDEGCGETTRFLTPHTFKMEPTSPTDHVVLKRRVYTQTALDNTYVDQSEPDTACDVIRRKCKLTPRCVGQRALDFLPIVKTVREYQWRQWWLADLISGLSVGFMHLPQGLGFGLLASLTPVVGLYTTFFPILVYALFGTSPHVSMGSNAVIALLTAGLVEREAAKLEGRSLLGGVNATLSHEELLNYKISVAAASCFIAGLILLVMGLLRLGFLTSFMARPFIGGFTFAAAVHIATSQVAKLFHLKLPVRSGLGKLVHTYVDIFSNLHDSNPADIIVGVICMAILLGVKIGINERFKHRLKVPIPIEVIVVILSTVVSHFAKLQANFGVAIVGPVPSGMPAPTLPRLEVLPHIAGESLVTAVLIFALTISMGKLTARLHDIAIDDNQELVAYGLCQLVGSFFSNFPSCIAPPRTMLLSSLGSRSTLSGFWSASFILLVLLLLGQLFVSLPIAMLAAMIIVAMKDLLMQIRNLKSLWHVNKPDFIIFLITAVVCVFGDLDVGLMVGLVVSMVTVLAVTQLAQGTLLGKAQKEDVIVGLNRAGVSPLPGVKIFRFEAALHFASQERFRRQLFSLVMDPSTSPRKDLAVKVIDEVNPEVKVDLDHTVHFGDKVNSGDKVSISEVKVGPGVEVNDAGDKVAVAGTTTAVSDDSSLRIQHQPEVSPSATEAGSTTNTNSSNGNPPPASDNSTSAGGAVRVGLEGTQDMEKRVEESSGEVRYLVLDCSAMVYVDVSGCETLRLVFTQFSRAGVRVLLSGVPPSTLATLTRAGVVGKEGENGEEERVFFTVWDALQSIRRDNSVVIKL